MGCLMSGETFATHEPSGMVSELDDSPLRIAS
jgi:hypothetical protein